MSADKATIEFWEQVKGCRPARVLAIRTDAPPPAIGAIINIARQDFEVTKVDYSIDQHGPPLQPIFRRNVMLRRLP